MFRHNLTTAAVLAALSSTAFAAETGQALDLETVHVSAQRSYNAISTEKNDEYSSSAVTVGTKIPASLRDIPQSISILTDQQIKDRDVDTFDQLARQTPGMRVLANDDGRSSVYARGYEYSEYNVDGLSSPMASIYGTMPNLFAFDRVELMRGPSGLFDSSGEMGGIVNLVRKRPTKDFQAHVGAGGGTQKQYKLEGDVSGRLNADGSVRGRVMAQTFGSSPKPAEDNNHHETVYAALDWDISPNTTLGLGYLYQQRQITPDNGLPTYTDKTTLPVTHDVFVGADWNDFNMKSHDVFADLKHYFDNGGYGKIGMRYADRQSDSNYAFGGSGVNPATNTINVTGLGIEAEQKAFTLDASYSQPFAIGGTSNEFVVGADYKTVDAKLERGQYVLARGVDYRNLSSVADVDVLASARNLSSATYITSDSQTRELGAYGKLVFRPLTDWSVIAGGRIGYYKQDNSGTTRSGGTTKTTDSDGNNTKFTGYLGTVWDFSDTGSLYASYSTLFRPQSETGEDGTPLKPREGNQLEVGYKGSYLNDRLNTRVSLYRLQDKNAAASVAGYGYSLPLAKRVMQGVETEISGAITPKWNIHAGYSYLNSKIKTPSYASSSGDLFFLFMPKHTVNLWTTYKLTPKFTVGGGVNAMSKFESNQNVKTGGYATFDMMAAYQVTPKLKVQVNADNIFNRKYYTRVGTVATFNIPGAERSVMANVRYDF